MSDSTKRKSEFMLEQGEIAEFLAKLGKDVEAGVITLGQNSIDLDQFKSIELKFKPYGDALRAKLKVKYPKVGTTDQPAEPLEEDEGGWPLFGPARPKYDDLKDRMRAQFKAICKDLSTDVLPEEPLARAFIRDCKTMTTYPDKGESFYPAFLAKVKEWEQAYDNQDIQTLKGANQDLDDLKKSCHDRFK